MMQIYKTPEMLRKISSSVETVGKIWNGAPLHTVKNRYRCRPGSEEAPFAASKHADTAPPATTLALALAHRRRRLRLLRRRHGSAGM